MTWEEVWRYFNYNWQNLHREVGFGKGTYLKWKKNNRIPMSSQYRIEKYTKGRLIARFVPNLD